MSASTKRDTGKLLRLGGFVVTGIICAIAIGAVAIFRLAPPEPVTIENDTSKRVRLLGCDRLSPLGETVKLEPGEQKALRPDGDSCLVHIDEEGATSNSGYAGCLTIPADARDSGRVLRVSTADPRATRCHVTDVTPVAPRLTPVP